MKKTLISLVLATFCLSIPVFGGASITSGNETVTPANGTATSATPNPGFQRRRYRRARRIAVRRYERRVVRRDRHALRRYRIIRRHRRN